MCGIVGFADRSGNMNAGELRVTVQRMAASLRHRGPEDQGCWIDSRYGLALGHRRLSIIDLSAAGHQPMISNCGRYVMVLNGEIYNFRDLRGELERDGGKFRGHSDTEVMLAAICRWGLDGAMQKFNGMFAFALWDKQQGVLHLGRDRAGEKPLYFGWAGETLLFASELKAFRCHPHFSAEIDRDVLALFLRHNFVPAPYSIYKGIRKLPAGVLMTMRMADGSCSMNSYWSLRQKVEHGVRHPFRGSESDALIHLDSLLLDAVQLRMESDVPLGAFLSGGVDSSLVVALMQARSARPVKTFTIGFPNPDYDEAPFARRIAQHLGTEHTDLYVTENDTLDVIPQLATIYDEPFADSSQIPTFLVSRLARTAVTVSLSGDGGDELFGGYDKYLRARKIHDALGKIPKFLRSPAATTLTHLAGVTDILSKSAGVKAQKLAGMLKAEDAETFHWVLDSYWAFPSDVVPGAREPETAFTDPGQWSCRNELLHTMMFLDALVYLPDDILVKVDRASMAVSLEARVPFLDHRVIEFAWQLPLAMKIDSTGGKKPLRRLLNKYVPATLTDRPKKGFSVPLRKWLVGPLEPWANALLDESRLRQEAYLDPKTVSRKWRDFRSDPSVPAQSLWGLLMFQDWLEKQNQALSAPTQLDAALFELPPVSASAAQGA